MNRFALLIAFLLVACEPAIIPDGSSNTSNPDVADTTDDTDTDTKPSDTDTDTEAQTGPATIADFLSDLFEGSDDEGDDETETYPDADGDGFTSLIDCDDEDPDIHPLADEICDGVDNNCDGSVDEGHVYSAWYADADEDGYGNPAEPTKACEQPSGYVGNADDCDDTDATLTTDCPDPETHEDADGDGFTTLVDCDDTDAGVHPLAEESCDGIDNDCDGDVDDDDSDVVDAATWYADTDGDGYGDAESTTESCEEPSGYASDNTDCNDDDAELNVDCEETEETEDTGDTAEEELEDTAFEDTAYEEIEVVDEDGDGVTTELDCDDTDAEVNPMADEICDDGVDNDCDGDTDESECVETEIEEEEEETEEEVETEACGDVCFEDTDEDGYNDVFMVSIALFTQGSTYQSNPVLPVGEAGSWTIYLDEAISPESGYFPVDTSDWSCGMVHEITLVSILDTAGSTLFQDTDGDGDVTGDEMSLSYEDWMGSAVWLQNYSLCTDLDDPDASSVCQLQDDGASFLLAIERDCVTGELAGAAS